MKTSNVNQGRAHPEAIIRGWVSNKRAGPTGITVTDGTNSVPDTIELTVEGGTIVFTEDGKALLIVEGGTSWYNVRDYGATGDGTTDDLTAINAAIAAMIAGGGGVLYFPGPYNYLVSDGLDAITVPTLVLGEGRGSPGVATSNSRITCSSATANLFTATDGHISFVGMDIRNSATTPSAGSGVSIQSDARLVSMRDCMVKGFYINLDNQEGGGWSLDDCWFVGPIKYAVKIRNISSPDGGDQAISNCWFYASDARAADAAIRIESGGGPKITNCKINNLNASGSFARGIDVAPVSTTTILLVHGNSIENVTGDAIHVQTSGSGWDMISIVGNQVGNYSNSTGNAIEITCANVGEVDLIVIANNIFHQAGGGTPATISLTKANNVFIGGNVYSGWGSHLSSTSSTNVVNLDLLGATPSGELGGTWDAITVDATHSGSAHLTLSSATPLVESGSGSAGSGTAASKDDHVHPAASSGGGGHILLADGHATPFTFNDLLQMDDGSDFMWSDS